MKLYLKSLKDERKEIDSRQAKEARKETLEDNSLILLWLRDKLAT